MHMPVFALIQDISSLFSPKWKEMSLCNVFEAIVYNLMCMNATDVLRHAHLVVDYNLMCIT